MRAVAPFSAEQAKAHQGAWSADLGVEVEIKNSVGMKLRLIPPGTFNMGSTKAEVDEVLQRTQKWNIDNVQSELPQRSVRIPRPFYIGIHELTVGQFRAFVTDAKYETWAERTGKGSRGWDSKAREMVLKPSFTWKSPFVANTENHPVVNLHREDVEAFCRWLSKNEERTYVIPSEQQWEFACRAGTNTSWHWGDNEADASKYTWFGEPATSARQMPVGLRSPNAFGLHDMSGNVAEMTRNEKGDIVMRGGHSGYAPVQLRSAAREIENHTDPTYRNGVRLAIDLSHPR
jgi:formylglycine-generating enzyme required for sulfatase activity